MRILKRFLMVSVLALLPFLLMGQGTGPTVFTPRLTVSPGPLTVSTGLTTVQNLTVLGTCTGCPTSAPGGSDTQVQFNNAGAFGGDAGLTYVSGTDTLSVGTATIATAATVAASPVCTDAAVVGGCQTRFSFTLNFVTACTTTPTMLMSAAKYGSVVSMRVNGTMSSCTGDSTSFSTSADVPSAIRPDANSCFSVDSGAADNGLAVGALFCIQTDGTVVIQECPLPGVAGFGCASGTWTASGTRFLSGFQQVFTYNLDQA